MILGGITITKYRYDIGLGDKYLYGTELEFTNVYLDDIFKLFRDYSLPVKFALCHKSRGFLKYDEWYLDVDNTVTKTINKRYFGGELSSKILVDKRNYWIELEDICKVLKESGASINENCSNHVRINLSCIQNESYFFEVLSKLIAIYEREMRLFYMGDDYLVRSTSFNYARPLGVDLLKYINDVNFYDDNFIYRFIFYKGIRHFSRNDAINLQDYIDKRLIEFRYANGSLNEKTIQNNINFSLKLVDAIRRELFDPIELSRKVEELKDSDDWCLRSLNGENSSNDFEKLVNIISTSSEDIDDFMSQYENVLAKKPKFK